MLIEDLLATLAVCCKGVGVVNAFLSLHVWCGTPESGIQVVPFMDLVCVIRPNGPSSFFPLSSVFFLDLSCPPWTSCPFSCPALSPFRASFQGGASNTEKGCD